MDNEEQIIKMYISDKMSACAISKTLQIKISTIYHCLVKNKIPRRSNKENSRKFFCDESFFEKIDSEEKAYWLGFIYADGYITGESLGITLSEKDKDHLVKFSKSISSTYPVHTYMYSGYKNVLGSRVILKSSKLVADLVSNGCFYNKSLILLWPTKVGIDFIHHFIRGYMDGDGSICVSNANPNKFKLRFEGTFEFLTSLMQFFSINLKLQKRNDDNKNSYTLDIGGNKKVLEKLNIIYSNATIFLDRKHERYKLLQSLYPVMDISESCELGG